MPKIIDLDFFRKYRIILPIRLRPFKQEKSHFATRTTVKQFRRRRKMNSKPKMPKGE